MDNISSIVLFISTLSKECGVCMKRINDSKLRYQVVRLDTRESRELVKRGKYFQINVVPTMVINYNDGNTEIFIGNAKIIPTIVNLSQRNLAVGSSSDGTARRPLSSQRGSIEPNMYETNTSTFKPSKLAYAPRTYPSFQKPEPSDSYDDRDEGNSDIDEELELNNVSKDHRDSRGADPKELRSSGIDGPSSRNVPKRSNVKPQTIEEDDEVYIQSSDEEEEEKPKKKKRQPKKIKDKPSKKEMEESEVEPPARGEMPSLTERPPNFSQGHSQNPSDPSPKVSRMQSLIDMARRMEQERQQSLGYNESELPKY